MIVVNGISDSYKNETTGKARNFRNNDMSLDLTKERLFSAGISESLTWTKEIYFHTII